MRPAINIVCLSIYLRAIKYGTGLVLFQRTIGCVLIKIESPLYIEDFLQFRMIRALCTIQTHRRNICGKFGLLNRKINLTPS